MEKTFTLAKKGDVFFVNLQPYIKADSKQELDVVKDALSHVMSAYEALEAPASDWVTEMLDICKAIMMEGKFPLNPHYGAGEKLRGNLLTTIFTYLGKEAAQVYVNVAATTIFDELLPLVESGREQVTVTVDFKDASQD